MTGKHATAAEIELYIVDALPPSTRPRFEVHVQSCARCSRALEREAALEVDLRALWPRVSRPLAEVIPLRPRDGRLSVAMAARAESARADLGVGSVSGAGSKAPWPARTSFAGAVAAILAVLLAGSWLRGGAGGAAPSSAVAVASAMCGGDGCGAAHVSAAMTDGAGLCAGADSAAESARPWALASWGMCARPLVAFAGSLLCTRTDAICEQTEAR